MLNDTAVFGSFAVRDTEDAKTFYRDKLGLDVKDGQMPGIIEIGTGGSSITVYPKPDHQPATFTVLNILVPDISSAVADLGRAGVSFEHYDTGDLKTDEDGVMRGNGPSIAWFKDPDGNILSVIENPNGSPPDGGPSY
jgi:catechol 2,3-dioxygenase-like lactoylglutathione lyase family enzyme